MFLCTALAVLQSLPLFHLYVMYLETIIDQAPYLQIIYHYRDDHSATVLETTWEVLDQFCAPNHVYELKLENYDAATNDISQTYLLTDLKTWVEQLPEHYKKQLVQQFIQYCEQCETTGKVYFFR